MKEKILLGIIFVLIVCIIVVNFFPHNKNNTNNNLTGSVKGAQAFESDNFDLSKMIVSIPQKSKNYYDDPQVLAQNYILIDSDTGTILANKNEHDQVSIASTTKIMTAIIALENYKLDEIVNITDRLSSSEESTIGLIPEDKMTVENLLSALMINSANDAAYSLADHMGYDKFISYMNQKAKYLGLNNTNYKDPAGFSDEGKSSAYDLAFITKYALLNDTFKSLVKTEQTTIVSEGEVAYDLVNSNRLIKTNEPLYYPSAIGVKTGFTYEAGHCLVSAANIEGHTLIAVVLHTDYDNNEASAVESKKLLEWGFDNYIWNK